MLCYKVKIKVFSTAKGYNPCPIKIEPTIGLDPMHDNPNSIDLLPIGTPEDRNSNYSGPNNVSPNNRNSPQSQHPQHGPPLDPMMMPRKKSKKGPAPKLFGNEKCKICESRATGFHYNVLSCEACKVAYFQVLSFSRTASPFYLYINLK